MERRPALQAITEVTSHIDRLVTAAQPNAYDTGKGVQPYTDAELLTLLPALEAQLHEGGVTVAALRATLERKLGKEPPRAE